MSSELTPKQDAFAQAYVETSNASEAYRRAYDAKDMSREAIGVEACRLRQNPNVTLKIEQLRERAQERHEITVDKLTQMLMDAYQLAMKDKVQTPSAAVSAVQVLGKLHGLIVDKSKNEHTGKDGAPLIPAVNVTIRRPGS